MFERYNQMAQIIFKYFRGQLNKEDTGKINQWLDSDPSNRTWLEELGKEEWFDNIMGDFRPLPPKESFNNTMAIIRQRKVVKIKIIVSAAAVLLAAIIGTYLLNTYKPFAPEHQVTQHGSGDTTGHPTIIMPNNIHTTLTLADGTVVDMDNEKENAVANQGNYTIFKKSSTVEYNYNTEVKLDDVPYNTLATPKGGQYHLILPDGSKAVLNAASSIKFPVTDTGSKRRVEIVGQVYFEVVSDSTRPFIVSVGETEITAKGTRFNVMAYPTENTIQTDLLEGKIEVTTTNQPTVKLVPGQSATIIPGKSIKVLPNTKIDDAIAWKNGQFIFDEESTPSVMRKLARWYDIEVTYINKDTPSVSINGFIARNSPIDSVLHLLERCKVYTKREGQKVKVSSNKIKQ